jgi:adenylate kinase
MSNKERVNLLYGPPASGKSSVAKEICATRNIEYLSVGDITRREIASGSPRGQELEDCLNRVIEYPVELITSVVEERIIQTLNNGLDFILDGYPKYPWEAEAFLGLLERSNLRIRLIIVIDIPLEEAIKRVAERRICQNCLSQTDIKTNPGDNCIKCGGALIIREDDRPEILRRRYGDYESTIDSTLKILYGHYKSLIRINGSQLPEEVRKDALSSFNLPG